MKREQESGGEIICTLICLGHAAVAALLKQLPLA